VKIFEASKSSDMIQFALDQRCDTINFHAGSLSKIMKVGGETLRDVGNTFNCLLDEIENGKLAIGQRFYTVLVECLREGHVEAQCLMTILSDNAFRTPPTFVDALRGAEDITHKVRFAQ
jgi:hypothetical protein